MKRLILRNDKCDQYSSVNKNNWAFMICSVCSIVLHTMRYSYLNYVDVGTVYVRSVCSKIKTVTYIQVSRTMQISNSFCTLGRQWQLRATYGFVVVVIQHSIEVKALFGRCQHCFIVQKRCMSAHISARVQTQSLQLSSSRIRRNALLR